MTDWQITIDCANPSALVPFWAEVLGYIPRPAPDGFDTWNDWYLSVGVPEEELDLSGDGTDRLEDPNGRKPNIWFQVVPERKGIKNRIHFDIYVSGGRTVPLEQRKERVDRRVDELAALGGTVAQPGDVSAGHYFVIMYDPEGNEFCVA
jgi:hypothetical protein